MAEDLFRSSGARETLLLKVQKEEEYSYNNNTPGAIIKLRQSNFTNGTVRITKPGIYILQENILELIRMKYSVLQVHLKRDNAMVIS